STKALSQSFSIPTKRSRQNTPTGLKRSLTASSLIGREKANRAGIFPRRDFLKDCQIKSGFGLLRTSRFLALRFQLSELLCRKNSFGLFEERLPAFVCAAGLHAFGLPRFDLCLLIWREIERCQIGARHRICLRGALGATCPVSCKRAGCSQHRNRD